MLYSFACFVFVFFKKETWTIAIFQYKRRLLKTHFYNSCQSSPHFLRGGVVMGVSKSEEKKIEFSVSLCLFEQWKYSYLLCPLWQSSNADQGPNQNLLSALSGHPSHPSHSDCYHIWNRLHCFQWHDLNMCRDTQSEKKKTDSQVLFTRLFA